MVMESGSGSGSGEHGGELSDGGGGAGPDYVPVYDKIHAKFATWSEQLRLRLAPPQPGSWEQRSAR
eukprot:762464-Rhodomonas_salina.1